jgi:hypothetical protein
MFDVVFGDAAADSQEDFHRDTLTTQITTITSTREAVKVTIEEGGVNRTGQRAHVTANVVHVEALGTLLVDQTWFGAWTALRDLWQFTNSLIDAWYAQKDLCSHINMSVQTEVYSAITDQAEHIEDTYLIRDKVDMQSAWFVRPKSGTPDEKAVGRRYFDHEPKPPGEYDATLFDAPERWRPNLSSPYVAEMTANMDAWIKARSLFPWTSVDTDSYRSGERAAVRQIDETIQGTTTTGTLSAAEEKAVATNILATFDFFPPTLNKSRTIHHAAGVAARHVAENFYYHPAIKAVWRPGLASLFISEWQSRTVADVETLGKTATGGKKARKDKEWKTEGLSGLLDDWDSMAAAYDKYLAEFSAGLP